MRVGPGFVKIGKAVLYPVTELDAWDDRIASLVVRQTDSWRARVIDRDALVGTLDTSPSYRQEFAHAALIYALKSITYSQAAPRAQPSDL
jgi:hypothetical protein